MSSKKRRFAWRVGDVAGVAAAILIAVVFGVGLWLQLAEHARTAEQQRALNLASFDQASRLIQERHFDPDLGGVDWQAVRDELRSRAWSTTSSLTRGSSMLLSGFPPVRTVSRSRFRG